MLSPIEFADQIFEELCFAIDQACQERYWFTACRPARVLGFTQTDVSTAFSHGQRFDLHVEPNIYLSLTYKSFEPSGAFISVPGISKFELTLTQDNALVRTYQNEFEEVVNQRKGVAGTKYSLGL